MQAFPRPPLACLLLARPFFFLCVLLPSACYAGKAEARYSFITQMAVFTLETDYSSETGYPFDDSRQLGNKS